ncbi:8402_t:CDS:2 [Rhizophagus irregularis]|nr:8402_t:CDS:2 [Rhizophagus irregularis]
MRPLQHTKIPIQDGILQFEGSILEKERYNGEANAISWRSEGQIDLRKTGTYAMASLRFFQDVSRAPKKAEDLSPEEDHWIKSAYMGGLVWAEPYEGIATELDYNEYYPHILAYEGACWPIADQKCTRTFRYNPAGYYTHYDIQMAIDLGLYIELSSESPNALIFEQNKLMSGHDIFHQWARYLTEIKHEGGQVGTVAKHMLVSLWGRLYSDGQRPGPHRCMAPFISAKGRKILSEKIRPLGDCVKRIHTDGFIISGKATNQLIERYRLRKIVPPTSTKSERSPIRYLPLPNEILDRIFHYHKKNEGEKLHPLLLVNKRWYYIARRLILQKIVLTGISGIKFTKALSKDTKPVACEQVLGLKFIGEINIKPDVYISEVCKACPNLQRLSFENSGSHILKNKNLETLLVECPNLKSLVIRSSRRLSPKTITKLPKLAPSLEKIVIRECLRIRKDILTDFQNLYPKIKLIFEEE